MIYLMWTEIILTKRERDESGPQKLLEAGNQHEDNHIKLGPENQTNCSKLFFLTFFCQNKTKYINSSIAILN